MPNLGSALKQEIVRLARREIRTQIAALQRASVGYRKEIAALKRHNLELQRAVQSLSKQVIAPEPANATPEDARKLRFRADGFRTLRKKLGVSAEDMANLLGVSAQSVYGWEHGRATPRKAQLPAIAALRSVGKREVSRRLAELSKNPAAAGER